MREEETRRNQRQREVHEEEEAKEQKVAQLKPCRPVTQPMQGRQGPQLKRNRGYCLVEGGKKPSFGILPRPLWEMFCWEGILTKMGRKLVVGLAFSQKRKEVCH